MISFRFHISILMTSIIMSISMVKGIKPEKSNCACSEDIKTLFDAMQDLKDQIVANSNEIAFWANHKKTVSDLKDLIGATVKSEMAEYASKGTSLPNSEKDDKWEKLKESQEKIENRTLHVEQQIRDEQRDRKLLQDDVRQTESSIEKIGKRTQNVEQEIRNEQRDRSLLQQKFKETQEKIENRTVDIEQQIRNGQNDRILLQQKLEESHSSLQKVEDRTLKVEQQIGNEQNDRRLLQQEVKETQSSLGNVKEEIMKIEERLEDQVNSLLYTEQQFRRQILDVRIDIRDLQTPDIHTDNCSIPKSKDPHLLIDIEKESDGTHRLIFGCRPIGQYVLNNPTNNVTCVGGSWSGSFPSCHSLLEPNTIEVFSEVLMKKYPCTTDEKGYRDPTNCSRFFTCSLGKAILNTCPKHKRVAYDDGTCRGDFYKPCYENSKELIHDLQDFIPPITIEPNDVDTFVSNVGTGPAGQLVVYPGTNLTLHCFYPQHIGGSPLWDITYSKPQNVTRSLTTQKGKNKVTLSVIRATEEDTGLYRCITPFGKSHEIYVSVKAVECRPIVLSDEYESIVYNSLPYDVPFQMNSRSYFPCTEGNVYAQCMANGKWSHDEQECSLKKRRKPTVPP